MNKSVRAALKGLSWRAFAAFDTMVAAMAVSYFRTGHIAPSVFALVGGIVGMELVTKTFLFAIHERLWERGTPAVAVAAATEVAHTWEQISERMMADFSTKKGWVTE